jgi:hypothetical protein
MMRKAIFNPLDALQHKPQPKAFVEININVGESKRAAAAAAVRDKGVDVDEEEGEVKEGEVKEGDEVVNVDKEEGEVEEKHKIKFVDKTGETNLNMELIMARINANKIEKSVLPLETAAIVAAAATDTTIKEVDMDMDTATVVAPGKRKIIIKRKVKKVLIGEEEPPTAVVVDPAPAVDITDAPTPAPTVDITDAPTPAAPVKRRVRKTEKPGMAMEKVVDISQIVIGDTVMEERLPPKIEPVLHRIPKYYMTNRKMFINTIQKLFEPYIPEIENSAADISCDKSGSIETDPEEAGKFSLLTHQKIVRDYLNLYTPYRGLLLYHGLGSGKTCTSIAIAEGMKSQKQIYIMTPASLKMNFFNEMKKCGDELYKRTQYWEFISIDGHPEYVDILSRALSLPSNYIQSKHGAWLVNIKKKQENYSTLDATNKKNIDEQLNQMIQTKYISINYNGLNEGKMEVITANNTRNPFDNAVVIIDEAHNFVSRIVNKLNRPTSISYRLYDYLMSASNARIVLLTGTPIKNSPNEIAVLYNMLRGYIKTWKLNVASNSNAKLNTNTILSAFSRAKFNIADYVNFSGNKLTITRNPFGFSNTLKSGKLRAGVTEEEATFERYGGVTMDDKNRLTDQEFIETVTAILRDNHLDVGKKTEIENYKPLMDDAEKFVETFVEDNGNVKNIELFKKRILGLTSYFRSAQEQLLPRYNKSADFHIIKCPMSEHQFGIYETKRKEERERESKNKKKNRAGVVAAAAKPGVGVKDAKTAIKENVSTYRIYSRSACNFVFPDGIERPVPQYGVTATTAAEEEGGEEEKEETDAAAVGVAAAAAVEDAEEVGDIDTGATKRDPTYLRRIAKALEDLKAREQEVLTREGLATYSPKFLHLLENIQDEDHLGLHLIYSTFRTLEGIGIIKLVLEANGFSEFKLQKNEQNEWDILENEDDIGKPKFALYTGTESADEKELIRNIYNGLWNDVPYSLASKLREKSSNNNYGEIIKILMITEAGSEGINLRNTRYVHIVEPFWHPVRTEQVIGRARRICSHADLPEELRTVSVFLYITTLSEEQKTSEKNIEIKLHDRSRYSNITTPITTDEYLYEISSIKENINQQILRAVKETAIDCSLYSRKMNESGERLVCYGLKATSNNFLSYPSLDEDFAETTDINVRKLEWRGVEMTIRGKKYVLRRETGEIYEYQDYLDAREYGRTIFPVGEYNKDGTVVFTDGKTPA